MPHQTESSVSPATLFLVEKMNEIILDGTADISNEEVIILVGMYMYMYMNDTLRNRKLRLSYGKSRRNIASAPQLGLSENIHVSDICEDFKIRLFLWKKNIYPRSIRFSLGTSVTFYISFKV